MAKDNSFDVVSEVDLAEVKNAVNQAMKEIVQRYDFKGTNSNIELNENDNKLVIATANEFTLQQLTVVLEQRLVKRKVPVKALVYGKVEPGAKDSIRQTVDIQMGIPTEKAREIVKYIKDQGFKKIQAAIQGEQVRISGKDRDTLQEVMAALRAHDFGIDMQFTNYRS